MGIAARTLKENGLAEQAKEMRERITTCGSYDETLGIIGQYVNIISVNEEQSSGFRDDTAVLMAAVVAHRQNFLPDT
jgi:hypothetical protein